MPIMKSLLDWGSAMAKPISHIPLLGPLVYCNLKQHMASLREMFFIVLFGTATFWLTSAFMMTHQVVREGGYLVALQSTVYNGELFIFAVGFLGPVLLMAGEEKGDEKIFPGRVWHIAALVIIGLFASGYHAQIKAAQVYGSLLQSDKDFLFQISMYISAAAIMLRYLTVVYRKANFDSKIEIKDKEVDWVDKYKKHVAEESQR